MKLQTRNNKIVIILIINYVYDSLKFDDKYRENGTLRILTPYTHIGAAIENRKLARVHEILLFTTINEIISNKRINGIERNGRERSNNRGASAGLCRNIV